MIELKRLTAPVHWRVRFDALLDDIRRRPFCYGEHDCALGLAAAAVEAITGVDIAARYRGRYHSRVGALRVLRNDGFADLAELAAQLLPEIAPGRAQRGDIVAFPDEGPFGFSLGVVNDERVLVLRETELGTLDRGAAQRAFRVG